MRTKVPEELERGRFIQNGHPYGSYPNYGFNGLFHLRYKKAMLRLQISDQGGWDHVSVSLKHRTPFWHEMCYVKALCFKADECVIQYHPPAKDYIDCHPYTLHLWRPHNAEIPMPPKAYV
jgi:hypothetical protein